jgi:hypothetical protein
MVEPGKTLGNYVVGDLIKESDEPVVYARGHEGFGAMACA